MTINIDGLSKRLQRLEETSRSKVFTIPHGERLQFIHSTDEKERKKKIAKKQQFLREKYGVPGGNEPPVLFICIDR